MMQDLDIRDSVSDEVRTQPWRFLLLGVVSMVLGAIGLLYAGLVTLTSILVFGAALIVSGCIHLGQAARYRDSSALLLKLPTGVLEVVVGLLMLLRPLASILSLTLVLGALFIVAGVFRMAASLWLRFENWGWPFASGAASLLLGALVVAEWPGSSLYILGLYVSAYLIVSGASFLALGLLAPRGLGAAPAR